MKKCLRQSRGAYRSSPFHSIALAVALFCAHGAAGAFEFDTGTDLKVRFDNTVKYSGAARLKNPSGVLVNPAVNPSNVNLDDGDRNFSRGLVSNRLDWLGELDVTYQNIGARVTAAAWYDSIYNRGNDNQSQGTVNSFSVPAGSFTDATRELHGRKAELLEAFVFGRWNLDGKDASLRLGRHAFLWGESLFFGSNGIAAAQAPVDAIKALSVPNTQFKELLRPVNQVSGQLALTPRVSVGGYYQFEWERNRLPASGSFFSFNDFLDAGGERLYAGPGQAFFRRNDLEGRNRGQGGLQLRWRMEQPDIDFGFYAVQYHDKSPQVYVYPGTNVNPAIGKFGEYALVYPEKIRAFGASFSTTLFDANVAGEVSVRNNAPLVSTAAAVLGPGADNASGGLYAVGRTAHAQVSVIQSLPANALWDGANLIGEVAWNRRLSIKRNAAMLDPNATRDAWGLRFVLEPTYFQVADGLDISVPIGVGYNPSGRSSAVSGFNGGASKGGDVSLGLAGTYLGVWKFSLNYTHYFGSAGSLLDASNALAFKQYFRDRDFVSFSLARTF